MSLGTIQTRACKIIMEKMPPKKRPSNYWDLSHSTTGARILYSNLNKKFKKLKTQVYPPECTHEHTHQKTEQIQTSLLPHNALSPFFCFLFQGSI